MGMCRLVEEKEPPQHLRERAIVIHATLTISRLPQCSRCLPLVIQNERRRQQQRPARGSFRFYSGYMVRSALTHNYGPSHNHDSSFIHSPITTSASTPAADTSSCPVLISADPTSSPSLTQPVVTTQTSSSPSPGDSQQMLDATSQHKHPMN